MLPRVLVASLPGYGPQVNKKLLGIYLNDHLGGSTTGIELVRRACSQNQGTDYGRFLAELTKEIEEDRAALFEIMDRLGIRRDLAKVAGGWVLEKMGRLKLNGQLRGYSPLSRLVELEGLALGVTGKLAGWKALRLIADGEPALDAAALEGLIERAERQQRSLEEHRLVAARQAFSHRDKARVASRTDDLGARARGAAPARGLGRRMGGDAETGRPAPEEGLDSP
jgi:hypothetical protein